MKYEHKKKVISMKTELYVLWKYKQRLVMKETAVKLEVGEK